MLDTNADGPEDRCVRTYTDAPAQLVWLGGGTYELHSNVSVLLHWKTAQMIGHGGAGGLAIRWVHNGERYFECAGQWLAVDDSSYLLLNPGTYFTGDIQSETLVECYTLSFGDRIVEEVLTALVTPDDHLLDALGRDQTSAVEFQERTYPHDAFVSPLLHSLAARCASAPVTHGWMEEQFCAIAAGLLCAHRHVLREIENLPVARYATRLEIYRRLHCARDFMEANLSQPLSIPHIADAACFSPYHFQRCFRMVFHETPHQYLTRRRLERARRLLLQTDMPVTEICYAVGFESLGSFSWLFRQRVGLSPEQFRRRVAAKTS